MSDPHDPTPSPHPMSSSTPSSSSSSAGPSSAGQSDSMAGHPEQPITAEEVMRAAAPMPHPAAPAAAVPPSVVVVPQGQHPVMRWFSWLGWAGLMFCIPIILGMSITFKDYFDTSHGVQEKFVSGEQFASEKIAIIRLTGAIMEGDGFVKHQIDRIREDKQVRAIVLRIDSPGGTISGSDFIYHHLQKLKEERKLPLVVSMGSLAASGGYYVAMAVGDQDKSIFAEPTTTTGSIGVIIPHYDLSGLMERLDIKDDSIATHPRKQILSMTHEMSADHRELLEKYIGQAFTHFKDIVKAGRPKFRDDPAALDTLATGEIFSAPQALEHGLVDALGFVEDAVARAAELANVDANKIRVVTYRQHESLAGALGLQQVPAMNPWSAANLIDLATPRAFYLSTSLPPLVCTWQDSN